MYGHSEIDLKFPTPIPVNITYQTAFVDDAGKLQIRKDVYGRDATMLALLQERPAAGIWRTSSRMPSRATPARPASACRPASTSPATTAIRPGPSFFERLFGGRRRRPLPSAGSRNSSRGG